MPEQRIVDSQITDEMRQSNMTKGKALIIARETLGENAHVRRHGRYWDVCMFNEQGGVKLLARALEFDRALNAARKLLGKQHKLATSKTAYF